MVVRRRRTYKPRPRRGRGRARASAKRLTSARRGRGRRLGGMPKRQVMQSSLGGLSITRFTSKRRPTAVARHINMTGSPNYINITYPGLLTGNGGEQQFSAWYLNAGNDLRRIWASIQSLYVNRNVAGPGTEYVVTSTGSPNINPTFRFVLQSAMSVLNLANTSGTPQNIELYDVVAKRDVGQVAYDVSGNPIKAGVIFGQGLPGIMDPAVAWNLGMPQQNSTPTGFEVAALESSTPYNLGSTPYNSKLFKDYYKVVRKSNVSLPIGGQHKHCVDLKPNFVVDNDILQQSNVFKGVSFFTLVVASGVPVVKCPTDTPSGPLANFLGDTTTSAVSVSIIQSVKYKWTWVEDSRENIYRANYINNANTNSAQTTQPSMIHLNQADRALGQFYQDSGQNTVTTCQPSGCTR